MPFVLAAPPPTCLVLTSWSCIWNTSADLDASWAHRRATSMGPEKAVGAAAAAPPEVDEGPGAAAAAALAEALTAASTWQWHGTRGRSVKM